MAITALKQENGEILVHRTEYLTIDGEEILSLQAYGADEKLNPLTKKRYFEINGSEEEYHTTVREVTESTDAKRVMYKLCTNPEWNPKQAEDENTK